MKRFIRYVIVITIFGAIIAAPTFAANITLKAGTFLPTQDPVFYPPVKSHIDAINEQGAAVGLKAKMVAAGRAMPPYEMGNALKTGVLDIVYLAGGYYKKLLAWSDFDKLSTITAAEWRKRGVYEFLQPYWSKHINAVYLGRIHDKISFHIFLTKKPIYTADLTGLTLRGSPMYRAMVNKLGGSVKNIGFGDTYTALERGVVDGYMWPQWGIDAGGWHKLTKYRLDPGVYAATASVIVNLDTWKKMTKAQQDVLSKTMIENEAEWVRDYPKNEARYNDFYKKSGIEIIKLPSQEASKLQNTALEEGWKEIKASAPDVEPQLRKLISK